METYIEQIQEFMNRPYVWITITLLGFLGVFDWLKHLVFEFLKEKGKSFRDLLKDKSLRRSFWKWAGKHYRQLPPWAKKISKRGEKIARSIGLKTRENNRRGRRHKKS